MSVLGCLQEQLELEGCSYLIGCQSLPCPVLQAVAGSLGYQIGQLVHQHNQLDRAGFGPFLRRVVVGAELLLLTDFECDSERQLRCAELFVVPKDSNCSRLQTSGFCPQFHLRSWDEELQLLS